MHPKAKYLVIIPVFMLSLYAPLTAHAVYPVHDSKVYQEVVLQVKKVTEQINTIRQQIELQKQHLYDISWGKVAPMLEQIKSSRADYDKLRSSMSSILSGEKDVEDAFKDTFYDWNSMDISNETYGSMKSRLQQDRYQLQKLDKETIELITHKQKEHDESNQRVEQYKEMLKDAHGDKDIGKIKSLITGEMVYSQNLTSDINSLRAKLEVIHNEVKKQEEEAAQKMNEKVGDDFAKAADELQALSDKEPVSSTYSSKFEELANERGLV